MEEREKEGREGRRRVEQGEGGKAQEGKGGAVQGGRQGEGQSRGQRSFGVCVFSSLHISLPI